MTHERSAAGAIACHSDVACDTAADSSDAATAWATGVMGAEAADDSAGFAVEVEVVPVDVDPAELVPVEVDPVELVPVEVDPVELLPVEVDPVELLPADEEPVDVVDEGDPTVTD